MAAPSGRVGASKMAWRLAPLEPLGFDVRGASRDAVASGVVGVIRWLVEHEAGLGKGLLRVAAESGRRDAFDRLVRLGCPLGRATWLWAASLDDLPLLELLLERGCPTKPGTEGDEACVKAMLEFPRREAQKGRLGLRELREERSVAAGDRHRVVLRTLVARERHAPKHAGEACRRAVSSGRLQDLEWLTREGCPLTSDAAIDAAKGGHIDALRSAPRRGRISSARQRSPAPSASCDGGRPRVAPRIGHPRISSWRRWTGAMCLTRRPALAPPDEAISRSSGGCMSGGVPGTSGRARPPPWEGTSVS